jgi:hypothetical protein
MGMGKGKGADVSCEWAGIRDSKQIKLVRDSWQILAVNRQE